MRQRAIDMPFAAGMEGTCRSIAKSGQNEKHKVRYTSYKSRSARFQSTSKSTKRYLDNLIVSHKPSHLTAKAKPHPTRYIITATMSSAALSGKVAIITGGSKGIGASTATALVKLGAKVVINYGHDSAAAESLVSRLGGADHAIAVQADAGSITGVETLVKCAVDKFGKIDILIPNAGILPMKTVEATTEADFDRAFNLNVKGPYFLVQKALPYMARGSRIVLLSTTQCHASTVTPPYTLYCATKGAIEQMVRTMSKDLQASKGISVNAVAPGPTGTDLFMEGKS